MDGWCEVDAVLMCGEVDAVWMGGEVDGVWMVVKCMEYTWVVK